MVAKKNLETTIKNYPEKKCVSLLQKIEKDLWRLGYKIVSRRLGRQAQEGLRDPANMETIVRILFSEHVETKHVEIFVDGEITRFIMLELLVANKSFENRKAPNPDGIHIEVIKMIMK